ncbi:TonB-dependent vitamin B12 receptor [Stutzerimonas stutzeri]|uniref:Vitamin B12 transporter n=1 Tax=Stutzerimonas stutzeri TaxID=316 RepID=A0A5S5B3T9_STUST|nr:TonB-dependent vitamin B12 receptor [Stutzerimonas stutzeri]TYP61671.1 vitamin B12 transporter [Stutzerimonas stutzeri]
MTCKTLNTSAAFVLLGYASLSHAQPVQPLNLNEQVVTATRTEQVLSPIASTSVITREQIVRSQVQSVPELLRGLAGVNVASNGGRGKTSSVYLRGTSSQHLLVLVDGVKIGSATSGGASLENIPVEQIERIELVRGPRSSLYGSEAVGGVMQIFTRRGDGEGFKPYFSAGAGSRSSFDGTAGISGSQGAGWFNLGVASASTDGINSRAYRPTSPRAYEADADGYRELSGALRGGYRFDNGLVLDGSWLHVDTHSDYDSRSTSGATGRFAYSDGSQQVIGGRARFTPIDPWLVTLQAGHSEDNTDNFRDGRFYSRFDTKRDSFNWQNDFSVAEDQLFTLGFDYQQDRIDVTDDYAVDTRDNKGAYLQYQGRFGRHGVLAGLRRDDNEQFGNHDTGNLGWSYDLRDNLLLSASYGTAFKAPTFNDLYAPDTGFTAGNPDLQPEESQSYELGLKGEQQWGEWSLNAFENQIDDLIIWSGSSPMQPQNVDVARIRGIEGVVGTELLGWDVVTSVTVLDPQDRSKANHGHLLPRRAKRTLNVDLDRAIGRFAVGTTLYAASERFDKSSNTEAERLPGYALVDLRGEYRLDDAWRLQAKLSNLFDRDYETAQTYEQPGRAIHFTIRYQAL